jgi:uncharacterized protein YuzE
MKLPNAPSLPGFTGLDNFPIDESEEVTPGVIFDFDNDSRIVGIEVLNASVRLPKSALVPDAA